MAPVSSLGGGAEERTGAGEENTSAGEGKVEMAFRVQTNTWLFMLFCYSCTFDNRKTCWKERDSQRASVNVSEKVEEEAEHS